MKSNDSLESDLDSLLPEENDNSDNKIIETSKLKITKSTILFDNCILQIQNISTIELTNLTKTYEIKKNIPKWYWFLLGLGIVLFFFYSIAIVLVIFVGGLFVRHSALDKTRKVEKYGLRISMNSGEAVTLISTSKEFTLCIIKEIYLVINNDSSKPLVVNFEDKSIKVGQVIGSSVVSGQVAGDVINRV